VRQTEIKLNRRIFNFVAVSLFFFTAGVCPGVSMAEEVLTTGVIPQTRFAPGEFLPVSVKLINFGSDRRVDVIAEYKIFNEKNEEILRQSETVAVETTASFIKLIQLPSDLPLGLYRVWSSINYLGQEFPAISQFEFRVERKILGFFERQFWFLLLGLIFIVLAVSSVIYVKHRHFLRHYVYHNCPDVPEKERIYYEILSSVLKEMRYHLGDKAIEIFQSVPGAKADLRTGRILSAGVNPAKTVALLVLEYEKRTGRKMSFSLADERSPKIIKNKKLVSGNLGNPVSEIYARNS